MRIKSGGRKKGGGAKPVPREWLAALYESGPVTARELRKTAFPDHSRVEFMRRGWIERKADGRYELTERGIIALKGER